MATIGLGKGLGNLSWQKFMESFLIKMFFCMFTQSNTQLIQIFQKVSRDSAGKKAWIPVFVWNLEFVASDRAPGSICSSPGEI